MPVIGSIPISCILKMKQVTTVFHLVMIDHHGVINNYITMNNYITSTDYD